ncbi:hypothetical protein [Methanonatronarchaeum sp. AMET-Sl]|uniref:hypothetical protein n=1 Tax=Methanonatronarchaeum sp. AMET-Sl TaxID=3037654 RepID=UPI00244DAD4E|nr:hypothetical protein [Methanonatronarchaeum sp. AMET-Sl]WGI17083.1 hypothetical protein QEN48_06175 [Methanonatronarchaeum sp. AMET-Sl]
MRRFVLYSNTGKTNGCFNINDLPGDGGRMDLVARSIISGLWISNEIRKDVEFIICLNGPPNPPISLKLEGNMVQGLRPNERSIGHWIKKVLNHHESLVGEEWSNPTSSNIKISRKGIETILDISDQKPHLMTDEGRNIRELELKNPLFIIGDHKGIPLRVEEKIHKPQKVSIGPIKYFSSQTITIINNELDTRKK